MDIQSVPILSSEFLLSPELPQSISDHPLCSPACISSFTLLSCISSASSSKSCISMLSNNSKLFREKGNQSLSVYTPATATLTMFLLPYRAAVA